MSLDAHGFPRKRRSDLGVDPLFALGGRTIGAGSLMDLYACWARADSISSAGGVSKVYLVFQVPPLPPGSVVLVTGSGVLTSDGVSTGIIQLAQMADPAVPTGNLSIASVFGNVAATLTGQFLFSACIQSRTTYSGGGMFAGATAVVGAALGTPTDFAVSRTWGLVALSGGGAEDATINHAVVELYIPRAYRG